MTLDGVRFWDPARQFEALCPDLADVILGTLRAGDLVMREQMYEFERHFASFIGTRHCVGVSNCTDGLRLTLQALGIGPGDEVITVAHTFVATLGAVHQLGAQPILVDIGPDHLMDTALLEGAVTEKTRAIIPVHLNGRTCNMDHVMAVANRHQVPVIEDAAQAVGARLGDRSTGTFGVAACYSFYPAKLLGALGDGGAVVTSDDALADAVAVLRDHGRRSKHDLAGWGWNCRLDNLQAAVLDFKLGRVPDWIERRRAIAARYDTGLAMLPQIVRPPAPADSGDRFDVYQNYVIEIEERDKLQSHLARCGIETMVSWSKPLHHQADLGLQHYRLKATEDLCRRVLSFPMYPELTDQEVDLVIDATQGFFSG